MEQHYKEVNRKLWNDKVSHHVQSDFYDVQGFLEGKSSLQEAEIPLLGEVNGKSILHLQCHFGQDTLSLARMGAKVTGADISDKAIEQATAFATQLDIDASFVVADVYDLPSRLHANFDIVFASYGVLGWLPDMERWAQVVQHFLKPGGKLVLVEFHPAVWMLDDDFSKIAYSYFNKEAIIEDTVGTYAQTDAPISNKSISWNHSLSEVMGSLLQVGLQITHFQEYDYSHYNCFKNMEEVGNQKFRHQTIGDKIPMMYSLVANK